MAWISSNEIEPGHRGSGAVQGDRLKIEPQRASLPPTHVGSGSAWDASPMCVYLTPNGGSRLEDVAAAAVGMCWVAPPHCRTHGATTAGGTIPRPLGQDIYCPLKPQVLPSPPSLLTPPGHGAGAAWHVSLWAKNNIQEPSPIPAVRPCRSDSWGDGHGGRSGLRHGNIAGTNVQHVCGVTCPRGEGLEKNT